MWRKASVFSGTSPSYLVLWHDVPGILSCDLTVFFPCQSPHCPALELSVSPLDGSFFKEQNYIVHSTAVCLALAKWWALSKQTVH